MSRKIGVVLSYVLMIFEVLSTLLLTPFIIRTLGQAEYGVYKLVAAINAYLLLLDMGVGNAVIRYIAKYRVSGEVEKERQFLAVATIFYGAVAVVALILGGVLIAVFPTAFANGLNTGEILLGQKLLAITMLNSAVTLGTATYNNVLIAYERFAVSRITSIIQIIVRMILTYAILVAGWGSIGIVTINLIMTVLDRAFFVWYVLGSIKLRPQFKNIQFAFVKEIVTYSSFILLQMIATQVNSSVDQILIGSLVKASATVLAIYGVGTQIVQYFQSIGTAFTSVLMPGVVKLVERKASPDELTEEMIRIGRIVFMVLVLIWCGFVICGKEFIVLWAGKENVAAYTVTMILMPAYIFTLTESVGTQILWAMNEHKEQSILKIAVVLLNIVLTAFLVKWNPLIGATIGTFISLMIGDVVVMNLIFKKKLKIKLAYYYIGIFKGIIPCIGISFAVGAFVKCFLPTGWEWLFLKLAIIVGVYGISMIKFGMSNYERKLTISIFEKIKLFGGKNNVSFRK